MGYILSIVVEPNICNEFVLLVQNSTFKKIYYSHGHVEEYTEFRHQKGGVIMNDHRNISDEMFELALQTFCHEIEMHIKMAEAYLAIIDISNKEDE